MLSQHTSMRLDKQCYAFGHRRRAGEVSLYAMQDGDPVGVSIHGAVPSLPPLLPAAVKRFEQAPRLVAHRAHLLNPKVLHPLDPGNRRHGHAALALRRHLRHCGVELGLNDVPPVGQLVFINSNRLPYLCANCAVLDIVAEAAVSPGFPPSKKNNILGREGESKDDC
jgi:hypothetical protein